MSKKKNNYHQYIYNKKDKRIIGNFESAYKNCDVVWPTQNEMNAPHFSYLRGFLLDLRKSKKKIDVLDIGCGYGTFVNDLSKYNIGEITGYDISKTAIEIGKKKYGKKISLNVGELKDIKESKKFEVILLLGVLWFLLDDIQENLTKIKNMLKHDGFFFLTLNIPEDPIGKEKISSYQDLMKIISKFFEIKDVFHWYHKNTIKLNELSINHCDILIKCKKKK